MMPTIEKMYAAVIRLRRELTRVQTTLAKCDAQYYALFSSLEAQDKNRVTIRFQVTDAGIGIPEDALDKVFSRFYQVDSSSTRTTATG